MATGEAQLGTNLSTSNRMIDRAHRAALSGQAVALAAILLHFVVDERYHNILLVIASVGVFCIFGIHIALRRIALVMRKKQMEQLEETRQSREQTQELFAMTDMLQAAETYEDAGSVLMATCRRLLPGYGVALYVFNNSRDRLDLARTWDMPDDHHVPEMLSPSNCWALKRGKPHVNAPTENTLCCAHHGSQIASVEIPMMACGQTHGLLVMAHLEQDGAYSRLLDVRRLGRALADSMSLALSNIGLREKLRTQSLRDPLTGLYNRRYMEDALERFVSLGSRSGASTTVIMLDLDNFKKLNDDYGHAKGDAVLRDVSAQIIGCLRPSDVVCRYGGEELVAILPDCSLEDGLEKAELLRQRIESLSASHECAISASLGVATIPQTATSATDIVPIADAALYAAKKAGKNCVVAAEKRAGREAPRLMTVKTKQN